MYSTTPRDLDQSDVEADAQLMLDAEMAALPEPTAEPEVLVLGMDGVGIVAENDFMRFYLTDCCGASAKGGEYGVVCRACYAEIDPALGDAALKGERLCGGALNVVYGDGLGYDEWNRRFGPASR